VVAEDGKWGLGVYSEFIYGCHALLLSVWILQVDVCRVRQICMVGICLYA
jgi:hypothetical protein